MNVHFIDTSVFVEILSVPGFNKHHNRRMMGPYKRIAEETVEVHTFFPSIALSLRGFITVETGLPPLL